MAAVEIEKLTKKFGAVAAVYNLTLHVPKGTVFGFLGPNGAGKTTTLRILLGLAAPTAGEVRILGKNIREDRSYLRRVGFLPDVPVFYNWMTAREYLRFTGELFGLEPAPL
ncbi:MAG TPA: ATP-binding cassette domain-containing protein, partial [Bacillota bacterium]|nr:ATP-binding cassette domain-containing protein [Bacillota bacterium]